ncbi:MAG: NTP transferase domain-containing protein [Bacteroidales bacterium]|nr:NTP transferase domain-containing protein [Bacteroidales bacterium]
MGKPKYNLSFSEEETFLDHIIHVYRRFVVSEMVLVVNESFNLGEFQYDDSLKIVVNQKPVFGRFFSIQLGLQELKKNTPVFIQNIDNPFVNAGLLMSLQNELDEAEFAVLVYEGRGGHPVLLSSRIIESLKNDFQNNDRFDDVLKSFERKNVIVNDPYIGVNINTPEDYKKYFSRQ